MITVNGLHIQEARGCWFRSLVVLILPMTEGRRCQVHLLDDRKLELLVQPKLMAKDLLDLVASHFNLKEKEYFGISYTDETGHFSWLQLDRRVLEHEFPKKSGHIVLYFCVRFYIESISYLKDNATIELFFLNAKSSIHKELIELDSDIVFELASYILQEAKGDFTRQPPLFPVPQGTSHPGLRAHSVSSSFDNEVTRSDLKKLPALPTQALKEHPPPTLCPLSSPDMYVLPVFQWRQLENLYFREKKFSVEVHDPRRASVTRRTFGHSGIAVHTWYACPALIKSIWAMAISQHQFYLDRKQSKSKIHAARSLSEIAIDLTETGTLKTSKLANMGSKGKIICGSSGSLLSSGSQESDSSQTAKKDMLAALRARQDALEDTLKLRLEELKKICIREAELTGKLPKEYPLDPGEEAPTVRRKIGTAFKLDEQKILPKGESQITEAARRLASDPHVSSKKLKKQRKTSYLNALKKLQEIENSINEHRVRSGKKPTQRASLIIEEANIGSEDSSLSDALVTGTPTFSPAASPHKGLPPRPPSHNRPPPPQSLDGLRHLHYTRMDYDKSPIKPKMWSESSLDEPYERVKKRSSHGRRFPSSGSTEPGGSNSLQSSPIRGHPHWNSQSSMPSTPDLRIRGPHYIHSTRLPDDRWYQQRNSSDTATRPPAPPPPPLPSRPSEGVRTICERDGVSRPLPSAAPPPSSPAPQGSLLRTTTGLGLPSTYSGYSLMRYCEDGWLWLCMLPPPPLPPTPPMPPQPFLAARLGMEPELEEPSRLPVSLPLPLPGLGGGVLSQGGVVGVAPGGQGPSAAGCSELLWLVQDEQSSSGSEPLERPGPRKKSGLPTRGCVASGSGASSLPWDSRLELRFLKSGVEGMLDWEFQWGWPRMGLLWRELLPPGSVLPELGKRLNRSSSLESQGKLLAPDPDATHPLVGSPDFFLGPGRSNGSDPLDDCSSCTSHSSSEHYYPGGGGPLAPGSNPNYSTLGEDSPSKARQRQRQRHRSAGHLGSSNSGSMPNLAAKNGCGGMGGVGGSGGGGSLAGGHHGVYMHSQSQPSSQYRIKEYPLYVEGSPNPVVVRSLESDQEGHYSVKAQFKTSSSYTAGGLYKEPWGAGEDGGGAAEGSGRLTPSRSQIVRTPSLGRDGSGGGGGAGGRVAVSDELRCWYQRSSGSLKEKGHSHSGSGASEAGSQQGTLGHPGRGSRVGTLSKCSPAASPHSQRSMTPSSDLAATPTPPCSPQHILNWQSGSFSDGCFPSAPMRSERAEMQQWYGQDQAKPGTLYSEGCCYVDIHSTGTRTTACSFVFNFIM
ncbi:LOW QUALITY PROTEIN: hypothetical protein CRUP_013625 [Coryphaenoides rupestris]|nr:LOW QUALITY PROTEIN: hypothetical protein CRUP_013625 [Coryphaenoides rupestris]